MPFLEGGERVWNEKRYLDETKKKTMGCKNIVHTCTHMHAHVHTCTHAVCEEAMILERTAGMSSL